MRRLYLILLMLIMVIPVIPVKHVEADSNDYDDGWVRVDDNTWTYTFSVDDDSLDWEVYESEIPAGYSSSNSENDPKELSDNAATITNTGNRYTLTLDPNNATSYSGQTSRNVYLYSKSNNQIGAPSRVGYTFEGWYSGTAKVFDAAGNAVDGTYWSGSGSEAIWQYEGNLTVTAKWSVSTVAITYKLNGGSAGNRTPAGANYGSGIYIDAPTKTGYAFLGWTVTGMDDCTHYIGTSESSCSTTTDDSLSAEDTLGKTYYKNLRQSDGTVVFEANWAASQYTIQYLNTDNATMKYQPTIIDVDKEFTVSNPVRPGWTFNGWDISGMDEVTHYYGDNSTTETSIAGTKETKYKNLRYEAGNVVFSANWTENVGTLTYVANGHVSDPDPVTMKYADEVRTPSFDLVTGYKFLGWSATDGGSVSYAPKAVFKEANTEPFDTTLYGVWKEKTWTVTYDYNDGETDSVSETAKFSEDYIIPEEVPTRGDGYSFKEWNTGRNGGGTSYAPGDTLKAADEEILNDDDLTLYAVWSEASAVITYDANGHGTAPDSTIAYYSKETKLATMSETGIAFKGWAVSKARADAGTVDYEGGTIIKSVNTMQNVNGDTLEDMTLYAVWQTVEVTLTVDGNGGTPETTTYKITYNTKENTTITLPELEDKVCAGLFTRKTGGLMVYDENGEITNDGIYFKEDVLIYEKDFTLYAQYGDELLTCVTYDQNTTDEVTDMPKDETKFLGRSIVLSNLIPKRKGYTFLYWCTVPDGIDGDMYYTVNNSGAAFPAKSDEAYNNYEKPITLYAIWQQNKAEESSVSKLPVTYNFYASDVKNGLLDAEITYTYTNFFRQTKTVSVRRTIFADSDDELTPELIETNATWHTGDEIPTLADIEGAVTTVPSSGSTDEPENVNVYTEVDTEEALRNAISNFDYANEGAAYILVTADIDLTETLEIPSDSEVVMDLGSHTLSSSQDSCVSVLGNLEIDNGTISASDSCISTKGMGWIYTGSNLVLADAVYAIWFNDYTGSPVAEISGSTVTTDVLCGTNNIYSGLVANGGAKIACDGLYADFTTQNPEGLVMQTAYTVTDPESYLDDGYVSQPYTADGYSYRIISTDDADTCTISAEPNTDEIGWVNGTGEYPSGQNVTLTAVPSTSNLKSEFVKWTDEAGKTLSTNNPWTFTCNEDMNITAVFAWVTHKVTTTVNDSDMGSVNGAGTYIEGQEATLTAVPNDGYAFVKWTKDGETISTSATLTITVGEEDETYKAVFKEGGFTLHIDVPSYVDAKITADSEELPESGDLQVAYNDTIVVAVSINEAGYTLHGLYDNNNDKYYSTDEYRTSVKITGNISLSVVFDISDDKLEDVLAEFETEQQEYIDSDLASYRDEYLDKAQPVGSYYITRSELYGLGANFYKDGSPYKGIDMGLQAIQDQFGYKWERVTDTFLYADGNKALGSTSSASYYHDLSLAMDVGSNSIAFETDDENAFLSYTDMRKHTFSGSGGSQSGSVAVFDPDQENTSTVIIPPYQTVYMFRRVNEFEGISDITDGYYVGNPENYVAEGYTATQINEYVEDEEERDEDYDEEDGEKYLNGYRWKVTEE